MVQSKQSMMHAAQAQRGQGRVYSVKQNSSVEGEGKGVIKCSKGINGQCIEVGGSD